MAVSTTMAAESTTVFFPLISDPRPKQIVGGEFIDRAMAKGFRDIIISAPTGFGKTAVAMATALWGQHYAQPNFEAGGYYLVTQKILQDQIAKDFRRFKPQFQHTGVSLKSASEYACKTHNNCLLGRGHCKNGECPYRLQRAAFAKAPLSVTNYPFFLTERTYCGKLPPRQIMIFDECHTIESQLLRFVEFSVTQKNLEEWAPHLKPPSFGNSMLHFIDWIKAVYLPALLSRLKMAAHNLETNPHDRRWQREFMALDTQSGKVARVLKETEANPDNWVFWQEENNDAILKPLYARDYFRELLQSGAHTRIYFSAYVGPTDVFCKTIGLDIDTVAHAKLASTFPVANRPVFICPSGSMGMKSIQRTLPRLYKDCHRILDFHAGVKGIIHAHSYRLSTSIFEYFKGTPHEKRLIFPTSSALREQDLQKHIESPEPTVLISPSMTEGFSLDDDQARFQILAKMPFMHLGDKQVLAKKERDPDWYVLQTVMTFLQTCGRIVRGPEDFGATYVLDSDFMRIFEDYPEFFPEWLSSAFEWRKLK